MESGKEYRYDAFISHAVEDKIAIANELTRKLTEAGIRVWYSSNEFSVGESIDKTIKKGLQQSRYGIVILSPDYLAKNWTRKELYSLWSKESEYHKVILPVWHNITEDELKAKDLDLANKIGIPSSKGIDYIVSKLVDEIKKDRSQKGELLPVRERASTNNGKIKIWILLLLLLASVIGFIAYRYFLLDKPSSGLIITAIEKRINDFQDKIRSDHELEMQNEGGKPSTLEEISECYTRFDKIKAYYRNAYEFDNGFTTIRFKKNVSPALEIDLSSLAPFEAFGFISPHTFLINRKSGSKDVMELKYILLNAQPVSYEISDEEKLNDDRYIVTVTYENYLRYIATDLTYSDRSNFMKKTQMTFWGFKPAENYLFEKQDEDWVFIGLE